MSRAKSFQDRSTVIIKGKSYPPSVQTEESSVLPASDSIPTSDEEIVIQIRELQATQFFPKNRRHDSKLYTYYSGCIIWDASVVLAR